MPTIFFTNLFIEDAEAILKLAYNADRSANYVRSNLVNGTYISATIIKNIEKSKEGSILKFDVEVKSSYWETSTLKELFEEHDWKISETPERVHS